MMSVVDKVLFLVRAPLTAGCATDALARLAAVAVEREVAAGEALFAAGDPPEALWILLEGAVALELPTGAVIPARPGDALAPLEILGAAPLPGTARALAPARLLRVARADLDALLDEDGELARTLFAAAVGERRRAAAPL
jgi:CRP-like cAMP-binding protein